MDDEDEGIQVEVHENVLYKNLGGLIKEFPEKNPLKKMMSHQSIQDPIDSTRFLVMIDWKHRSPAKM